ncbi:MULTISPECIES: hypothetical protein [Arthrobacter]|uniref:Uncharacterized protein n=1 Tax=Arthrobacter psychrochitiniphilus TaxID=291045 RepID=A0A2V3DU00_9MICC|nr:MULTISPECIES: hypothetical protein [Arthrobacter]NYG19119.1 3-polyprenyl-4-hydroxybenzoate decarboxylase [Arthrobacter psychrochitiniphilus]PXA65921.1 hypothetical protein CVS29_07865 [Arthrobacter psychrochitiniphilus]
MKSPFTSVGIAAVLTAGLIMAPGLSAAQASGPDTQAPITSTQSTNVTGGSNAGNPISSGAVSTYGMFFIPCNIFFLRLC